MSLDLTTLSGDDTEERVVDLCTRAKMPVPDDPGLSVAAVCVYPVFVPAASKALEGSGIQVATVSASFPHGLSPLECRVAEVAHASQSLANEVDVVIRRDHALQGRWQALYDEIAQMRAACGEKKLKVILATGELGDQVTIFRASMVAMAAGADFIKTSTGKESVNATIEAGAAMVAAQHAFWESTGRRVGLKPAGGVRTAGQAMAWLGLVQEELGQEWTGPDLFRIGASSLLDDLVAGLG